MRDFRRNPEIGNTAGLSSTVSRAPLGIISFTPIVFVEEAVQNGGEHGAAIRSAVGGDALEDAEVSPEILEGLLTRLQTFVEPFAAALDRPARRRHAREYLTGLLSKREHKTGEAIAYTLSGKFMPFG